MKVSDVVVELFNLGLMFLLIPIPIGEYKIPLYAFFIFSIISYLLFKFIGLFMGGGEDG